LSITDRTAFNAPILCITSLVLYIDGEVKKKPMHHQSLNFRLGTKKTN